MLMFMIQGAVTGKSLTELFYTKREAEDRAATLLNEPAAFIALSKVEVSEAK